MIDKLEGLAIKSVALKDPEYFYRRVCRYYSEKFHTPLMDVYELPWAFVFTNYIEHIVETNNNQEGIYDLALEIHYPELVQEEEQELQDWIKKIEEEEEAKRQAKKQKEQKASEEIHISEENEPEQIHMDENDFAHLEQEMEEEQND